MEPRARPRWSDDDPVNLNVLASDSHDHAGRYVQDKPVRTRRKRDTKHAEQYMPRVVKWNELDVDDWD